MLSIKLDHDGMTRILGAPLEACFPASRFQVTWSSCHSTTSVIFQLFQNETSTSEIGDVETRPNANPLAAIPRLDLSTPVQA